MKTRLSLESNWEFTLDFETSNLDDLPEPAFPQDTWLAATVPGTVHTDLLTHGLIEDPFYRDNELSVQWVDKLDWLYRTTFEVDAGLLNMDAIQLAAAGLDTLTEIFLNGHLLARTDNMHVAHRFEVRQYLQKGVNELRLRFRSPTRHAKSLEKEHGVLCHTHESHRLYMRKAQYSFGWDWGPVLPSSGIWKPIYLEAFSTARVADVLVKSTLDTAFARAELDIHVETEWLSESVKELQAKIEVDGRSQTIPIKQAQASTRFTLEKPQLWWPAGYGEQPLYELKVALLHNGREVDQKTTRFALRKLELVQEKDEWGESFYFKINDVPIFCKGANWIPSDSFLPRVKADTYRTLLQMARDANMNMIRIWGGGIYEQEIFYDLCDELGLLVWQDFMFACGGYPEHEDFQKNVATEIEHVVKRLRNHACIAIWCGNNENQWIWFRSTGNSYQDMPGLTLFHELIPGILKKLDPTRPYWPSSPFGGADPNAENQGNRHQWEVWSNWMDFTNIGQDHGRFITEFGFQAPANLATFEAITLPEDRHPQSEIMEFHNKQVEGQERLFRFLAGHVKMPRSFEDFIYKTQLVQGEALKACLEHWRRNKFRTAGSIIWQLNDCWPVSSWSLIDSALTPKASYFYTRRAFQPVLISFSEHQGEVSVWITNDALRGFAAELIIRELTFTGDERWREQVEIEAAANTSVKVHTILTNRITEPMKSYLKAELVLEDECIAENRFFFKRLKHLHLPRPKIEAHLRNSSRLSIIEINSASFAKSVCIRAAPGYQVQDNWFDLDANASRYIEVTSTRARALTRQDIRIDYYTNAE